MKLPNLKAEHQEVYMGWKSEETRATLDHLITQHNALMDYLAERDTPQTVVTIQKPEWWMEHGEDLREGFRDGLEAASKASGILFKLED